MKKEFDTAVRRADITQIESKLINIIKENQGKKPALKQLCTAEKTKLKQMKPTALPDLHPVMLAALDRAGKSQAV